MLPSLYQLELSFLSYLCGSEQISDVICANLERRHLNSDQRACIAVDALPLFEVEAKKRQVESKIGNQNASKTSTEIIPELIIPKDKKSKKKNSGESRQKAAKKLNTNRQYLSDAKKLQTGYPGS